MNRRLRTMATIAAVAAGTLASTSSASAAAVSLDTPFFADAYNGARGATSSAPATSPTSLTAGKLYVVRVKGAVSFWAAKNIAARGRFTVCGSPLDAPKYLGSDGRTGRVGIDAESRFAFPTASGTCPSTVPFVVANTFVISTSGAYYDPTPIPTPEDHSYAYGLVGAGLPLHAKFNDPAPADNYGALRLRIREATVADCKDSGWQNFAGITSQKACKQAVNGLTTL